MGPDSIAPDAHQVKGFRRVSAGRAFPAGWLARG